LAASTIWNLLTGLSHGIGMAFLVNRMPARRLGNPNAARGTPCFVEDNFSVPAFVKNEDVTLKLSELNSDTMPLEKTFPFSAPAKEPIG